MRIDINSQENYYREESSPPVPQQSWRSSIASSRPSMDNTSSSSTVDASLDERKQAMEEEKRVGIKDEKQGLPSNSPVPPNDQQAAAPTTLWGRFKQNKARVALLVTFSTLALLAVIIIPIILTGLNSKEEHNGHNSLGHHNGNGSDGKPHIVTPGSSDYRDPFDDSARAHEWAPPLTEKFRYNAGDSVRGINIGGWLVLEPFITPKIFEQTGNQSIIDEYSLCQALGPEEAKRQLKEHYETFITEADFKKIAEMGFNHVRIPTGHWAVQVTAEEPYVPFESWQYLLKGIQWARKYGLRVMVELHTAPGSQNGWNHSGKTGSIGFLNGTEGDANGERTLQIATEMIRFFNKPEWSNVVPVFGVLNEPTMVSIPSEKVKSWYEASYNAIRKLLGPSRGPQLTYHDGFLPLSSWKGFFGKQYENTILETHLYMVFNNWWAALTREQQVEFPCDSWKRDLTESKNTTGVIMVGEFSIAINDCGKYLNGIGLGARYDGTLLQEGVPTAPACETCTCAGVDDWKSWTPEYKEFLLKFMEKQMDAFEVSVGWFYWTYKTEDHVNPHWDYSLAWEQGFAPKNVNLRTNRCAKPNVTTTALPAPK